MEGKAKNAPCASFLSEGELRILEHIEDAVLVASRDGTVVFANDACRPFMGTSAEEMIGKNLSGIEADSLTVKAMANRTEVVNVRKYVEALKCGVMCSVLLLPSPDDFSCAVTIVNRVRREGAREDFETRRRYVESCLDAGMARSVELPAPFSKLIGDSGPFRAALYMAYKASRADFSVLVTGESGVGKELLVRAIHEASNRCSHEFVSINCAAIPGALIESELFGYASGSFTGGRREGKKGLFALSDKGAMFFDEVADFELSTQAKILRVLEEKEFRRVGDQKCIPVDTRILSATNKDLGKMMAEGRFREDLYYRLNTMTIHVPPLRERSGDIEALALHFLAVLCARYKREAKFGRETLDIFFAHPWPGNARELRSVVSYALNMADSNVIEPSDLPHYLLLSGGTSEMDRRIPPSGGDRENFRPGFVYKTAMEAFEKDLIEAILKRYPTRTKAMEALGLSRRAFYLKLKKHCLL
ncbi:MAG: sigma 54-interacting transcriptional regulator [Syntrophobacteraceae bacterium]|nr:sigma 54-interacting transcriptional regulator [Syntrophobacteraceae bacterium]